MTDPNSRSNERVYTVRASSWGDLFSCAYRWEGKQLLGMKKPSGMRAVLGTAIHAGTAAYDALHMQGHKVKPDYCAQVVVDKIRNPGYEVDYSADELTPQNAEVIGLKLYGEYCEKISPRYTFKSVELTTKPFDIDCGNGVIVRLTGTMDRSRMVEAPKGMPAALPRIVDLKSGASAVEKGVAKVKGHSAQLGTYQLLYEHTTGEEISPIGEIIGLKTKGELQVAVGTIQNAKQVMLGPPGQRGLIQYAAEMFKSGLFPPNPQDMLCGKAWCPRWHACPFHE